MKVTIDRTFPMPGSAEVAWSTLADIEAVASCMPGAKITERVDERRYKGTVTVKVGPAMLAFKGEIDVQQVDAASRTLHLVAKGTDTSGTSAASLDLTARIEATADGLCALVGHSEASVSGKAATFGGRMMDAVADQILKQFAANFAARVAAAATPPPAPPDASGVAPESAAAATGTAASPPPLSGLAFVWAIVKDWLKGLFARRTA